MPAHPGSRLAQHHARLARARRQVASVVFADADLERCASETPMAVFANAGQDCCARSRILVERSAYTEFVDAFSAATERVRMGDPLDEATEMGPMISEDQAGRRSSTSGSAPRRRAPDDRRRPRRRRRVVPHARGARRRRQLDARRSRGDLRPRGDRHPVRLRARSRPSQLANDHDYGLSDRCGPRPSAGRSRRPTAFVRACCR